MGKSERLWKNCGKLQKIAENCKKIAKNCGPQPPPPDHILRIWIFLWLPYANIFTTGPPVFVNAPFWLGKITNCSVETVSHHFSFL